MMKQRQILQKLRSIGPRVQPLTVCSSEEKSPVSDLFIWKKDKDWKTYFRLVNQDRIVSGPGGPPRVEYATFIYFSHDGTEIKRIKHVIPEKLSTLISITADIADCPGTFGTFCVIHSCSPKYLTDIDCQLTERGYVGYSFLDSKLLSYAHGNLDAVGMRKDGSVEMLGGSSILRREYRLQYSINPREENLLAFVNPCKSRMRLEVILLENGDGDQKKPVKVFKISLPSRGSAEIRLDLDSMDYEYSIRIKSRLCMARPVLFTCRNTSFNVFHG